MKYLCMVFNDEKELDAMARSEWDALMDEHLAYDERLRRSGHLIMAEALQPVHTATTVRMRNGRVSTTDGPFVETKEQLGGIYLIEATDLNDAIRVAANIPAVRLGSAEVRPLRPCAPDQLMADEPGANLAAPELDGCRNAPSVPEDGMS